MSAGPAGSILFQCTGPAEWEPAERRWRGEIKITRRSINMAEPSEEMAVRVLSCQTVFGNSMGSDAGTTVKN